jgi:hypothetical protein
MITGLGVYAPGLALLLPKSYESVYRKLMERISLSDAISLGDLEPFIRQAEAETISVDRAEFEA